MARSGSTACRSAGRPSPASIAAPLLDWFGRTARPLPWREARRDPYRTWVSEVMLQQTRVDVVVPYYRRFLASFPTLRALAAAPLDEVLANFSGLGYYARARNLHRAARAAVGKHGGELPRSSAALRALPGFGPYTAAAVASLAFGEQVPLVDGNVARVLARLLRLPGDAARVRSRAWQEAGRLLPADGAGRFNEALMELGATVCTPRAPRCGSCPLAHLCGAHARGIVERFPAKRRRAARQALTWAAVLLRRPDGAVLLVRRPPEGLFAGLWDLPSAEVAAGESPLSAARALLARWARAQVSLHPRGSVEQTLTHRELRIVLFSARSRAHIAGDAVRWVTPTGDALRALGLSAAARKCLGLCGLPCPAERSARSPAGRYHPSRKRPLEQTAKGRA